MRAKFVLISAVVLGAMVPAVGWAQTSPGPFVATSPSGFGATGTVAISNEMSFDFGIHGHENAATQTEFKLAPAADYFILNNISVGGQFVFDYLHNPAHVDNTSATTVGLVGRAGISLPLAQIMSLWIRGGFGYFHTSESVSFGNVSRDTSTWEIPFVMDVNLLVHVFPHLFVGGGPALRVDLGAGDGGKETDFDLGFVIGGWF